MTVTDLLELLERFEREADPGPDRRIVQAYIRQLFTDGSGYLDIELASTQPEQNVTDTQQLISVVFLARKRIGFEKLDELLAYLNGMKVTPNPQHDVNV